MNTFKRFFNNAAGLALIAFTILGLIVILALVIGCAPKTPLPEPLAGTVEASVSAASYPPPPTFNPPSWTDTALPEPTLNSTHEPSFPETPPAPAGKAATLFKGDIWLVEPGMQPQMLTSFSDVAVIFGWNLDGTRLLFGRGRDTQHAEFVSDTTELWYMDVTNQHFEQITRGMPVNSAAWSPQGDKIAYSEKGNLITIVDLLGSKLYQQEHVLLGFSWSPDGQSIALLYYSPKMDVGDLVFAGLAIWQYEKGNIQPVDDAWEVVDSEPVWSMDGQHILFDRGYYGVDQTSLRGMLIFNLVDRTFVSIKNVETVPIHSAVHYFLISLSLNEIMKYIQLISMEISRILAREPILRGAQMEEPLFIDYRIMY